MSHDQQERADVVFRQQLPPHYTHAVEQDIQEGVQAIVRNLQAAVDCEDFDCAFLAWLRALERHQNSSFPLTTEQATQLVQLMHGVFETHLDSLHALCKLTFLHVYNALVKRRDDRRLSLVLPWRPYYRALRATHFHRMRELKHGLSHSIGMAMVQLVRRVNRMFPASTVAELMQETTPYLCPLDMSVFHAQAWMATLMPTERGCDSSLWLPQLLGMWNWQEDCPDWDIHFLMALTRLAKDQCGDIDWDACADFLFAKFSHILDLPVGSVLGGSGGRKGGDNATVVYFGNIDLISFRTQRIGKLIAYMITPTNSILTRLEELTRSINFYFHPSNGGAWSGYLAHLLFALCDTFHVRYGDEQGPPACTTPEHSRLTPAVVDRFVDCTLPLVQLGIFSKSPRMLDCACSSAKALMWLRGERVVHVLLGIVHASLSAVNETHRTQAAFTLLNLIVHPMLQPRVFAHSMEHLPLLLCECLPGVDPNDPVKTQNTLAFFHHVLCYVRLEDEREGNDVGLLHDWAIQLLDRLFDMMWTHQQGGGGREMGEGGKEADVSELRLVKLVCLLLFAQMDDGLYKFALDKTVIFVRSNFAIHSLKHVGQLLFAAASARPHISVNVLVPVLAGNLLECDTVRPVRDVKYDAHSVHSDSEEMSRVRLDPSLSEGELQWSLHLLARTLKCVGEHVLPFLPAVVRIVHLTILHPSKRVFKASGKLLRQLLYTLTHSYVAEYASGNGEGCPGPADGWLMFEKDEVRCKWHTPSVPEVLAAAAVCRRFLALALHGLGNVVAPHHAAASQQAQQQEQEAAPMEDEEGNSNAVRALLSSLFPSSLVLHHAPPDTTKVVQLLMIVRNLLRGAAPLMTSHPDTMLQRAVREGDAGGAENHHGPQPAASAWDADAVDTSSPVTFVDLFDGVWVRECGAGSQRVRSPTVEHQLETERSEWDAVHAGLVEFLRLLSSALQKEREDDAKCLRLIPKLALLLITNRGAHTLKTPDLQRAVHQLLPSVSYKQGTTKRRPRFIWLMILGLKHQQRVIEAGMGRAPSPAARRLLLDSVFELATGHYSTVRRTAQHCLYHCAQLYRPLFRDINLKAIDILSNPSSQDHQITGAVYILHRKTLQAQVIQKWDVVVPMLRALANSSFVDKPSVQNRVSRLFSYVLAVWFPIPMSPFAGSSQLPDDKAALVEQRRQSIRTNYDTLIAELVDIAERPTTHWRYATLILALLSGLIQLDSKPPLSCALLFAKLMLSESVPVRSSAMRSFSTLMVLSKEPRERECVPTPPKRITANDIPHSHFVMPASEEEWNACDFQDKNWMGWNGFPVDHFRYKAPPRTLEEAKNTRLMLCEELMAVIGNEGYWETFLLRCASQPRQGEVAFNSSSATMFKGLLQVMVPLWRHVWASVRVLMNDFDDRAKQCCAAEALAGMVRASKHWPYQEVRDMWDCVIPCMQQVLTKGSRESLPDWWECTRRCVYDRDTRRLVPLAELLFDVNLDNSQEGSLLQVKHMTTLGPMLSEFTWRGLHYADRLFSRLLHHLAHPYKQVREQISISLFQIFHNTWQPSRDPDTDLPSVHHAAPQHPFVSKFIHVAKTALQSREAMLASGMAATHPDLLPLTNTARTVLDLIAYSFQSKCGQACVEVVLALLPHLLLACDDPDDDVCNVARGAMTAFSAFEIPLLQLGSLIPSLDAMASSPQWHVRAEILQMLQPLVFRNHFLFQDKDMLLIETLVLRLLVDPQVEVRYRARDTLSGIFQISHTALAVSLCPSFVAWANTRVPVEPNAKRPSRHKARVHVPPQFAVASNQHPDHWSVNIEDVPAVTLRHAGVLGLMAIVLSHPYDVPDWMPSLLVELAEYISEPVPIADAVKQGFNEFWRTHQDLWAEHKLKFSSDELLTLTQLLVSPSYYS